MSKLQNLKNSLKRVEAEIANTASELASLEKRRAKTSSESTRKWLDKGIERLKAAGRKWQKRRREIKKNRLKI